VARLFFSMGLSPRVRGSRRAKLWFPVPAGSIPARAGEPTTEIDLPMPNGVYPRACGGAPSHQKRLLSKSGLSPRVRGSPNPNDLGDRHEGSIPARAGEPSSA